MKTVKTSMLAIAAGVLISPALMAANAKDESGSFFYSDEYLSTAAVDDTIQSGWVGVELGAEYAVNDVITWNVSGDAIEGGFPTSVTADCAAPFSGITLGLLNSDANSAQYRVTELDQACGGTTTVGQVVLFSESLELNARAVDAAGTIVASFSAETNNGLPLDTTGGTDRSENIVVTGSQFEPSVIEAFNGVIDVNQDRERFTNGCCDNAEWNVDAENIPDGVDDWWIAGWDPLAQELTVEGDFGWIFDTDENTAGVQPGFGVLNTSCANAEVTATALTADCDFFGNFVGLNVDANVDADDNPATLAATTFVSTHVLNFFGIGGVEGSITVIGIPLGAWTLNGFQAKVAYMPFQTGIGQVIYIANRSDQSGAITVDWIDQNGNSGSFSIGEVAAGSTRAIGPAIQAGLPQAQQEGGRLALTITANVPACDAQLNAQYNVSGDRAFSVATTNCGPF